MLLPMICKQGRCVLDTKDISITIPHNILESLPVHIYVTLTEIAAGCQEQFDGRRDKSGVILVGYDTAWVSNVIPKRRGQGHEPEEATESQH